MKRSSAVDPTKVTTMQTMSGRRFSSLLKYVALTATVVLLNGCGGKPIAPSPAGGASGAQQVLNNPNESPELKAQAIQQQQVGQLQNQALEQAHEREMAAGQTPKN